MVGFAISIFPEILLAQSITTFAGGGPIGDGRLATNGVLSNPNDVAFDSSGNVYIADKLNNRVRRIDAATGMISTVAGGGTSGPGDGGSALDAEVNEPGAIDFDGAGNLFIAEQLPFEERIRRVDTETGIISTVAGGGSDSSDGIPATDVSINTIRGLAVDSQGNIYFSERHDHRVRRIDATTGRVTTIAGTGEGGDGLALEAKLNGPWALELGSSQDLFISEVEGNAIRKLDFASGMISTIHVDEQPILGLAFVNDVLFFSTGGWIVKVLDLGSGEVTTVAGSGVRSFSGDGGPAIEASLNLPQGLATAGNQLLIADLRNRRIRAVNLESQIIDTVAGGGPVGDGGPATAANLSIQSQVALDPAGNLHIADLYRIRKVTADGIISTVAGDGVAEYAGDGGLAKAARIMEVHSLTTDAEGNIYIGTLASVVRRIDRQTGVIETVVGDGTFGYGGDGGPATEASIGAAWGLAFDEEQNLYISDPWANVIRKVSAADKTITTVAGTGAAGFSGDGGLATEAQLNVPIGIAVDSDGNLFIADQSNHRIRRIDAATGVISTVAGTDEDPGAGNGAPATEERLHRPVDVAFDGDGNLFIAESAARWVRRVEAETKVISLVAGDSGRQSKGDGGLARDASISLPRALEVTDDGTIFISDQLAGRVRVIYPCGEIGAVSLSSPADGETNLPTAPTLRWQGSDRAFRFDVLLAKQGEQLRTVASDLTTSSFTPQNLEENAMYRWQVRAKGDPFCSPVSESPSAVRTFTVAAGCLAPNPPRLASPSVDAVLGSPSASLTWDPSPGASRYDVHLGSSFPPPFHASTTITSFTTAPLVPGTTYYWSILAHAACDPALRSQSEIRAFSIEGICDPAEAFDLQKPQDGATNVSTTTTLSWSESENAASYDLFLGTTNPPAIFLLAVAETSVRITGFDPHRTYFWRVKANITCDDTKSRTSEARSFTTGGVCKRPQGVSITFTPPGSIGVGQTYAIGWNEAIGLDAGGTYIVERSLDSSFSTILDSQELTGTTANFIAESPAVHYHRIRPVTRCDASIMGPNSTTASVSVVPGASNIIFTVEPQAVVSRIGRNIEDSKATFTLENISDETVTAVIGRAEIESVPFFQVIDPLGGDAAFVTLEPRQPKTFEIRFSGPSDEIEAAYQGLVVVTALGSPVIPYAFVNLKVGDRGSAAPEFRVGGARAEYTFFPGLDGDDAGRPPITVEIHNPGSTPMELGGEIGPEVWLEPDVGWNDAPIPAGGTRSVKLFTRRNRALNGSALPRYTYFTVRTKTGETARLLVQDNGASAVNEGRTTLLEQSSPSFIVPDVVSDLSGGGTALVSKIRMTNLGSDPVQAELIFTPSGSDGFSSSVRRALIVVPPNDVTTLTDPLVQVFGLSRPAVGQIEVRASEAKLGLLSIESSIVEDDRADSALVRVPTVRRSEGARVGTPHEIVGITSTAEESTSVVLVETSGADRVTVELTLHDGTGVALGRQTFVLERYGHLAIDDIGSALGGGVGFEAGRLTITCTEHGGSVAGVAMIRNGNSQRAAALTSTPLIDGASAQQIGWSHGKRGVRNGVTTTLVAPYVASGRVDDGAVEYSTVMGFQAPFGGTFEFNVTLTDSSGQVFTRAFQLPSGAIVQFSNVIKELFEISDATEGSIVVEAPTGGSVFSRLATGGTNATSLPLVSSASELVSMAASARPLYVDGLEQSTDPTRGTRWNLHIREIAGASGSVILRLYEAGNRTHPIAVKEFGLGPNEQLSLETVFDGMDLNTSTRRKDRTNVLLVLTPKSGDAQITAMALEIDNRTGAATSHTLQPASGLSPSGVTTSLVRVIELGSAGRRRAVGRPD